MADIGSVLKQARLAKGMTLEDLSSKCGYSKALISRIENDSVSPSITSLTKISEVLNLKLYEIFASIEVDRPSILREKNREKFTIIEGKYEMEFLADWIYPKMMQPFLIHLRDDGGYSERSESHSGEEFLQVLQGKMKITVGKEEYILEPGDSIYFKSATPHKYGSVGKRKAVSLVVTYPPHY